MKTILVFLNLIAGYCSKVTSDCLLIYNILKNNEYVYQNFSRELVQIYRLCIIIEKYGRGVAVTKYNPKTKKNEIYRVKREKDKKGNEVYKPLIYK